nr:MAG TPA: Regulatory protein-modification, helix-turn-helix, transcriptional regulator, DNA [Caudoviricetes sp.]
MPKVALTAEDRLNNLCERRDKRLKGVICQKMTEYNIPVETMAKSLKVSKESMYRRLRRPSDRMNINELSIVFEVLHISNDEICNILR